MRFLFRLAIILLQILITYIIHCPISSNTYNFHVLNKIPMAIGNHGNLHRMANSISMTGTHDVSISVVEHRAWDVLDITGRIYVIIIFFTLRIALFESRLRFLHSSTLIIIDALSAGWQPTCVKENALDNCTLGDNWCGLGPVQWGHWLAMDIFETFCHYLLASKRHHRR